MKLSDIISLEKSEGRLKNTITLYLEGGWYRAYEWSAWLAHFFPNGLTEVQRLSPNKRNSKELEDGIISVGLKLDMISKFMPGAVPAISEGRAEIMVDLSKYDGYSDGNEKEILKAWKDTVPIKEKSEQKNGVPQLLSRPMTFSAIMKEIISFQLESRTPEETYKFVRELKNMVAELI